MSKTKFLTYIIIGLAIINIILLGFMVFHPKGGGHNDRPKRNVLKHLNFNDTQLKAYDGLIEEHQVGVKAKNAQLNTLKNKLYETLKVNASTEQKDSLIQELGNTYIAIEVVHYEHFEAIKALCKEEQVEGFDNLVEELSELFKNRDRQTKRKKR